LGFLPWASSLKFSPGFLCAYLAMPSVGACKADSLDVLLLSSASL
jgi:hypothetical protein